MHCNVAIMSFTTNTVWEGGGGMSGSNRNPMGTQSNQTVKTQLADF